MSSKRKAQQQLQELSPDDDGEKKAKKNQDQDHTSEVTEPPSPNDAEQQEETKETEDDLPPPEIVTASSPRDMLTNFCYIVKCDTCDLRKELLAVINEVNSLGRKNPELRAALMKKKQNIEVDLCWIHCHYGRPKGCHAHWYWMSNNDYFQPKKVSCPSDARIEKLRRQT